VQLHPTWTEGWGYLAASLHGLNRYADARDAYHRTTALTPKNGPSWAFLGLCEYELRDWLEQQPKPQLVFVRYSPDHNMNFEWVYNHADIMHSHVIWERSTISRFWTLMQDRTVWLVEADRRDPQLIPYDQANAPQHRRIRREPTLSRSSWNRAGGIVKHSKARLRNIAVLSLA